jgi:hypothetical protein
LGGEESAVTLDSRISGMPTCVRQAWLVHPNGSQIQLDNPSGGWMCQSLDLGTPIMRTVMNNSPDQDGIIDRTAYMGARTVVAAITALTGAGAQIDAVAASFAPYMVPSVRPVLHYVLDRPGAPERTLTLRPDSYDWPIVGAAQRDVALQWIAPNPIAYDPTQQSLSMGVGGSATLRSPGDVLVRPLLQFTGPLTFPSVVFTPSPAVALHPLVRFGSTYTIASGAVVTVDCAAHTTTPATELSQLDWANLRWPALPVNPGSTFIQFNPSAGTGTLAVLWNNGYLT